MIDEDAFVHDTAFVDDSARVLRDAQVWRHSTVREDAVVGAECLLGQNVVVGPMVRVGMGSRVQNNVSLFEGVALERDVFVGPSVTFTNVKSPRVGEDGEFERTYVRKGATIGANATIICGNKIGPYSMIGAGAVITKDVKSRAIVVGNPGRVIGYVCNCGRELSMIKPLIGKCRDCDKEYEI